MSDQLLAQINLLIRRKVVEASPWAKFKIALENGYEIIGYTSGKMGRYNISVLLGDWLKFDLTPYDLISEAGLSTATNVENSRKTKRCTPALTHRPNVYH